MRRGDIVYIDLEPTIGSEQGKIRPAVIISCDSLNIYAEHVIILPITSKQYSTQYPMHVKLVNQNSIKSGTIKVEHIRAVSKKRIIKKIGTIESKTLSQIGLALQKICDFY